VGITMIAAMDRNRLIGRNNELPWRIPADMAYFVRMTKGKTVVMGRKTLESFNGPLKNRTNVVLTRSRDFRPEGCEVVHSVEEALARYAGGGELMIIGGAEVYKQFLPYADKLLLTEIDEEFEGDTYFPSFDEAEWKLSGSEKGVKNDENPYDYWFRTYVRR
jgi:Dihydrofolate reductase